MVDLEVYSLPDAQRQKLLFWIAGDEWRLFQGLVKRKIATAVHEHTTTAMAHPHDILSNGSNLPGLDGPLRTVARWTMVLTCMDELQKEISDDSTALLGGRKITI